jgi:hypothetical protein
VQQLEEGMGRLASVSAEVEASLAEVQAALKEERTRQQQFQVKVIPCCGPGSAPLDPDPHSKFKLEIKGFQAQIRVQPAPSIRIRIQNYNSRTSVLKP